MLGCLLFKAERAQGPFQSTLWLLLCRCWLFKGVSSSRDCGLDRGLAEFPTRNAFKAAESISGHTLCHPTGQAGTHNTMVLCGSEVSGGRNAARCQEKTGRQCFSSLPRGPGWSTPQLSAGRRKPRLPGSSSGQGCWEPSQSSSLARLSLN